MSNTTGVTSGVESAYPSGEPKILVWVRFSHSLLFGGNKTKIKNTTLSVMFC
jgi:hypothetical protein